MRMNRFAVQFIQRDVRDDAPCIFSDEQCSPLQDCANGWMRDAEGVVPYGMCKWQSLRNKKIRTPDGVRNINLRSRHPVRQARNAVPTYLT